MTMVAKRVTWLIPELAEGERESLSLTALRDTQLPKLISDELGVRSAKHIFQKAEVVQNA